MWIVSGLRAIVTIALAAFVLGFFCGVSATRSHAHCLYISVEEKPAPFVEHDDSLADVFFSSTNVDNFGSVAIMTDETQALHVEQGIANIPEPSTDLLFAIGMGAIFLSAYRRRIAYALVYVLATIALMTDASATPPDIIAPFPATDIPLMVDNEPLTDFQFANGVVTMTGKIQAETPYVLDYYMTGLHWNVRELSLNSHGGSVMAAFNLAHMVEAHHWSTVAGTCESACVIVWAAGKHRLSSGGFTFGFHQAANTIGFDTKTPNMVVTEGIARYLRARGAPSTIIAHMRATSPHDIYRPLDAEMRAWR